MRKGYAVMYAGKRQAIGIPPQSGMILAQAGRQAGRQASSRLYKSVAFVYPQTFYKSKEPRLLLFGV